MAASPRCFNVYIDESGDEGFRNPGQIGHATSSEWLVLGGVIVPEEDDLALSRVVDRLRVLLNKPPPKPLHWRFLKKHEKKRAAMASLATEPFTFSVVAIWKPSVTSNFLKTPPHLYNYAARFLIERLSWYADDRGRRLNLFFENRSATSYTDLASYMQWIQFADPNVQIRANSIQRFQPVSPTVKLAQVADFYTSASAAALEPDNYGYSEEDYLLRVKHQLYREAGKAILSYGFKIFPPRGVDHARYPWLAPL